MGRGVIGHLTGATQVRGWAFIVVACVTGAIFLAAGAYSVLHGRRGLAVIIPLAVIVAVGCIGEPLDIIAGNPLGENLIGLLIIAAAATPVVLLLLPRRTQPSPSA
jgi:hypothetical protein